VHAKQAAPLSISHAKARLRRNRRTRAAVCGYSHSADALRFASQGWSHSVIENLLSLHGSCPVVNGSDAAEVAKWTAQVFVVLTGVLGSTYRGTRKVDRAGQSFLPLPAACRPRADPFGFEPSLRHGTVGYSHVARLVIPRGMVGPITPAADRCAVRRCAAAPSTMQGRSSMREHWCFFSAGHGWSTSHCSMRAGPGCSSHASVELPPAVRPCRGGDACRQALPR
jgi:hypothetical protein